MTAMTMTTTIIAMSAAAQTGDRIKGVRVNQRGQSNLIDQVTLTPLIYSDPFGLLLDFE